MKTKLKCFLSVSSVMIVTLGCNNNSKLNDELKKVTMQRDSVIQQSVKKDSMIHTFVSSFAEIENNLLTIKEKEKLLSIHSKNSVEKRKGMKDDINENIKVINELMDKNRNKISALNSKLKNENIEIKQLEEVIGLMALSMNNKNEELRALNNALAIEGIELLEINTAAFDLAGQNINKTDTINQMNMAINTAYYIIGKDKELKDKKVLNEKGGFIGIGRSKELNSDLNQDAFKKVDIKQTTTIAIAGKKAKLITSHPSSSYKMEAIDKEKHNYNLSIVDPVKFWSESKYLVIVVE